MDLLKRLDMNVDFAAVDQGTSAARIRQKSLPSQGGWHVIVNGYFGVDCADPTSKHFRANGDEPTNGWAHNQPIEAEIAAWYNATSLEGEKTIARRLNRLAVDHALFAPLGVHLWHSAWRKTVTGNVQAPLPLFWGVSKSA